MPSSSTLKELLAAPQVFFSCFGFDISHEGLTTFNWSNNSLPKKVLKSMNFQIARFQIEPGYVFHF